MSDRTRNSEAIRAGEINSASAIDRRWRIKATVDRIAAKDELADAEGPSQTPGPHDRSGHQLEVRADRCTAPRGVCDKCAYQDEAQEVVPRGGPTREREA